MIDRIGLESWFYARSQTFGAQKSKLAGADRSDADEISRRSISAEFEYKGDLADRWACSVHYSDWDDTRGIAGDY
jgi:hypothetical protein